MRFSFLLIPVFALLLTGCPALTQKAVDSAPQVLLSLDAAYIAAANGEKIYMSLPIADPTIVSKMKIYDELAFEQLQPITAAVAGGAKVIDATALQAAQTAISALTAIVNQNKGLVQ